MSHEQLLVAVVKRAFDDINLFNKKSDESSIALASSALRWVVGDEPRPLLDQEDIRLQAFMSFKNICAHLKLPYSEMRTYASMLAEGKHELFHKSYPKVVWSSQELQPGIIEDRVHLANTAEGLLRAERSLITALEGACSDFSFGSSIDKRDGHSNTHRQKLFS